MLDQLVSTLGNFSTPLGWAAISLFLLGTIAEWYDRDRARPVMVVAWGLFGLFWFTLIPHFIIDKKSFVEGIGSIVAVPLSLYVAVLLWRGRDSLFTFSRAVAVMGLVYVPFVTVPVLRQTLIEMVTDQTAVLINLVGFDPGIATGMETVGPDGTVYSITGKTYPYESTFVFDATSVPWIEQSIVTYTIAIACTGIGSMAIFVGLIAAVRAPMDRKLRAFAVSIPVIYVLNLVRNVFIGVTFGKQMTNVFPDVVMGLFSLEEQWQVSYIVSDRILAQSMSVVALVVITWLVVRELPEVLTVIEDLVYVLTGKEYDLQDALGIDHPDGESSQPS
ncbi:MULTISPECIES: archaeosortase A [Salinibaculum]|uniref:archaeosortase A n=1 Tax=Salinibaculum TaxID=2732368 RepID=UPI0030CB48B7